MSLEQNKAIARRHFEEVWNKGDMSAADQIYAPDYLHHPANSTDMQASSRDEFKKAVADGWAQGNSDQWRFTIEDMIAEGDRVVIRWSLGAAGEPAFATGIDIQRILDGQIKEDWNAINDLSVKK